ncbi:MULTISPECIES: helix-hairpin-helix domain-containing protein [Clostridium]|uniref:Helix-hairpin-helix DNA-binding motif class 1 domain-containing protein n=1 Tax=Clostridium nitritogenes TaxID=83340 RepID=A0ABN1LSB3_9CLOT|nr:helix-hairpin-helix domain-containing protein [Clostridium baratii]MBT9831069.1 competence protein ComEA [Clostridium baratii]MDY3206237.1 helix-hairpin-helix domain-containing protein [Clostridium baratii]
MRVDKKGIGLILIALVIGAVAFTIYITNGRDTLKKNDTSTMFVDEGETEQEKSKDKDGKEEIPLKDKKIAVDIKGEVKKPGVYYVNDGSIILDLINEAGGTTNKANLDSINRAQKLKENECIVIPNIDDVNNDVMVATKGLTNNSSKKEDDKVNINTADVNELNKLNGVGPSKANAIIKYREENGSFKSIEDIKNVSGFGEATFEKIKDSISI